MKSVLDKKKRLIKYIVIVTACFALVVYMINTVSQTQNESAEAVEENCETMAFGTAYQLLNRDLFGKASVEWFDDALKQKLFLYSEKVKGEFAAVQKEESMFPAELILALENMIYQSLDSTLHKYSMEEIQESIYFKTINAFGAERFRLNLEEMEALFPSIVEHSDVKDVYDAYKLVSGERNCQEMFHFHMTDNQDNYVFAVGSGGSYGITNVRLTKRVNDEFVVISAFETQNSGYGSVIQFEDDFYYIFLEYNYVLKNYDGIRIYKLGENAAEENLKIKYLPQQYIWETVYNTSKGADFDSYIESIKKDITSDEYLENGKTEGVAVYYGDEEKTKDIAVPENDNYFYNEYYRIDFANIGVPVYMRKSCFIPSSYNAIWHLKSKFYIQKPDQSISELEQLEIGSSNPAPQGLTLVQMWFKEMGESVYTCCLYHASDYNYVLNIVLIEGDKVSRIRTELICPQRGFTLTEGEVFHY